MTQDDMSETSHLESSCTFRIFRIEALLCMDFIQVLQETGEVFAWGNPEYGGDASSALKAQTTLVSLAFWLQMPQTGTVELRRGIKGRDLGARHVGACRPGRVKVPANGHSLCDIYDKTA